MDQFNWRNEMPDVPENIHVAVIKALDEVATLPDCHRKSADKKNVSGFFRMRKVVIVAAMLLCFLTLSAFAYSRFSGINGDELSFDAEYQGNGIFKITITNYSDRDLKLQEQAKVMRWSSAEEVRGDASRIIFENMEIEPHAEGTVVIDLSEGYDITELEKPLPSGDWYYLVLTNNNFVFGQDWMCSVDFEQKGSEIIVYKPGAEEKTEDGVCSSELKFDNWVWPTTGDRVSVCYGEQKNGTSSDHINIGGSVGDPVYAVENGIVLQAGYEVTCGNYILLKLDEDITVQYGHLKEILAEEGEKVSRGQKIAELGKSGMAAGANLSFAVYINGESVNPLAE